VRVYSASQAADLVGVSRRTVHRAIQQGTLPATRDHYRCFVRADDLARWFQQWQQRGRRARVCRNGHDLWAPYVRYVAPSGTSCCRLCASERKRQAYRRTLWQRLATMPSLAERRPAAFAALCTATRDLPLWQRLQAGIAFWEVTAGA
jgi:excisionase family DNA binding protein